MPQAKVASQGCNHGEHEFANKQKKQERSPLFYIVVLNEGAHIQLAELGYYIPAPGSSWPQKAFQIDV